MVNSTVENLQTATSAGGTALTTDLYYVYREGAPDEDYQALLADITKYTTSETFIGEIQASNDTTLDFQDGVNGIVFDDTFDSYLLRGIDFKIDTNTSFPTLQVYTGGTIDTGASDYSYVIGLASSSGSGSYASTSSSSIRLASNAGADSGETFSFDVFFYKPTDTNFNKIILVKTHLSESNNGVARTHTGTGVRHASAAIDGCRISLGGTNEFVSGKLKLYGLR